MYKAPLCVFRDYNENSESTDFPGGAIGKKPPCQCKRRGFDPWVGKIPWRRAWQPTLIFLPGESHGQRSQAGYGPQGHKESNTTEPLSTQAHGVGVCTRQHHGPIVTADPASPLHEVM